MCRQFFLAGLAAAFMFMGCKLHQQEPVAQQKSIPRLLDELSPLSKNVAKIADSADEVSRLMRKSIKSGLDENDMKKLAEAIIASGSKGIAEFKNARLRVPYEAYVDSNREIMERVYAAVDKMSVSTRIEYDKLRAGNSSFSAADFLKKNTNIADDRIFVRLVKEQDVILDDVAEAIAVNHVIAEQISSQIATTIRKGGVSINGDDVMAALKVGPGDVDLLGDVRFFSRVSGVRLHDEAGAIRRMLGDFSDYENRSAAYKTVAGKMENPFDRVFKFPIHGGEIADNPELLYKQFWQDKK